MTAAVDDAVLAHYVYGVVRSDLELPPDLTGLDDQPVTLVASGDLAVLVSPVDENRTVARRADLFAHSRVLDRRGIEPADLQRRAAHAEIGRKHQVGRFRGAAGKDDTAGLGAAKQRHVATGIFDERAQRAALSVNGRRVAKEVERRQASLARFGQKRRRGVPVHIDARTRHDFLR